MIIQLCIYIYTHYFHYIYIFYIYIYTWGFLPWTEGPIRPVYLFESLRISLMEVAICMPEGNSYLQNTTTEHVGDSSKNWYNFQILSLYPMKIYRNWTIQPFVDVVGSPRRRVLIIGGSFSGLAAGRDLGSHYLVTIIDAKEWSWGFNFGVVSMMNRMIILGGIT